MGEIMHLFGELGGKNDLIKVLTRYKHRKAAKKMVDISELEYKRIVPALNSAIKSEMEYQETSEQSINEAIKKLTDEFGVLYVATAILKLSDGYANAMKSPQMGINPEYSNTKIADTLSEMMKLQSVAEYLEGMDGNNK